MAQNYGKGGAGFYDRRWLGCMTMPELRIQGGGELQWRREFEFLGEEAGVDKDLSGRIEVNRGEVEVFGRC
jgi:hypothetical protein